MENKRFSIEQRDVTKENEKGEDKSYKKRILSIANGDDRAVHAPKIKPGGPLHNILENREHYGDSGEEVAEYEPLREEICAAFGVRKLDEDHVWIREVNEPENGNRDSLKQRSFRVFCVLINTEADEQFYGEGRMAHKEIFDELAKLAENQGLDISSFEELYDYIKSHPDEEDREWVFQKGFMSKDGFADLPERFREGFEQCIVDKNGNEVETPESWFVSGGSLSSR